MFSVDDEGFVPKQSSLEGRIPIPSSDCIGEKLEFLADKTIPILTYIETPPVGWFSLLTYNPKRLYWSINSSIGIIQIIHLRPPGSSSNFGFYYVSSGSGQIEFFRDKHFSLVTGAWECDGNILQVQSVLLEIVYTG